MSKNLKREIEELRKEKEALFEENKLLREKNVFLEGKLATKRKKLQRSSEDLQELAERKAIEILREEERYKIIVNIQKGGVMNFTDSPKSPPTSPKKVLH